MALAAIFVVVVYGALSSSVLPTDRPLLVAGLGVVLLVLAGIACGCCAATTSSSARDWLRPLADAPRALLGREGAVLLVGTFVLWAVEAAVYLAVARSVELDFSITGALYLVALTNFVAAAAAPGSIGTFDAAVAFGARRLGASGSMAVTYMLLLRFVLYIPITVVGLVILVTRYGGWSRLRTAVRLGAEAEAEATAPSPRRCGRASHSSVHQAGASSASRGLRAGALAGPAGWSHGRQIAAIMAGCLAVAAVTLLLPSTPTYDPWAWILWGGDPPPRPGDRGRSLVEAVPDAVHRPVLDLRPGRGALPVAVGRARAACSRA